MFDPEALIIWPDGTWCYAHELAGYDHMGDDYCVFKSEHRLYPLLERLLSES